MKAKVATRLWWSMALGSVSIAAISYRYLLPHPFVPPDIAKNLMARPWLVVHAAAASTALALGPLQFLPRLRAKAPRLHRWTGRFYVCGCLAGGASGLLLAAGTNAGPVAQAGFATLAVAWIVANVQAWRLARAGRYAEHRRWMVRSFAMTFAAVTLRVYLPFGAMLAHDFMAAYRVISWLSWVPNLIVAEIYLNRAHAGRPAGAVQALVGSIRSQRLP